MNQKNKKNNRRLKVFVPFLAVVMMLFVACAFYLSDYYHTDMDAVEAFVVENLVEMWSDEEGNLVFEPEHATTGLIFYPGGKVEYTAYIPLMKALASEGIFGVLVEMPFHLAVLDIDAAEGIQKQYPQIGSWYIGGHSLGGSMAAAYLAENADDFEGLVLLGAYSATDLSEKDLSVLSVYGSEDLVMNGEKYEANKVNLPGDFSEVILNGGCHAYFGMYGAQEGDGIPQISNEEQIYLTVEAISQMLIGIFL